MNIYSEANGNSYVAYYMNTDLGLVRATYIKKNIYLDKLAHVQVVIICRFFIVLMCTWEDTVVSLS